MAINPNLLVIKSVDELESVTGLQAGEILFYDGSNNLKKISVDTFNNLSKTAKPLKPTDATPTIEGLYKPTVAGTYANAGGLIAQEGYDTLFFLSGTTWTKSETKMPFAPADALLNKDNLTNAVTGNATDLYLKKIGAKENGKPTIFIDDSQYTNIGNAVLIGSGSMQSSATYASTDFIELPLGWSSINFYQVASSTYGLAFYDSNQAYLSGSNYTPVQDSYININKSSLAVLSRAKYIKHTKLISGNNSLKNRLLIVNDNSIPLIADTIVKSIKYDQWKSVQENSGNLVAEYNFDFLNVAQNASVNKFEYFDLQGFTELYISALQSSAFFIAIYDSNFTKIVDISADLDISQVYKIIKSTDYANIRYLTIYGLQSTKDKFIFSVGFPKSNKQIDGEGKLKTLLNLRGKTVDYLDFNNSDFPLVGLRRLATGGVDPSFNTYRSTDLIKLPENWQYLQYDTLLSGTYGLVFFDINKKFIRGINNPSTTRQAYQTVNNTDIPNAYYVAYSYTSAFRSLNFRIVSSRIIESKEIPKFEGKISNLDISDFDKWNAENPTNLITKEVIFDNSTVTGRPYSRIPGAIVTNALTYIGASEMRSQPEDLGTYDLYIKRKAQGGSWTLFNLFPFDSSAYGRAMNPSFVVDRTGAQGVVGRIYCFVATVKDPAKLAYQSTTAELDCIYKYSDDDGLTWSTVQSIKSSWDTTKYKALFVSPDNGIQLTNGTFVLPCMGLIGEVFYSGLAYKKVGENWVFSELTPHILDNESCVVEFSTNRVLLNCRVDATTGFTSRERSVYEYDFNLNKFISHESDKTFNPYHACQGSLLKIKYNSKDIFLFSYPDKDNIYAPTPDNSRYNQTVFASLDCKKWVRVYVANHERSWGYGVLSFYNNKLIYVYEATIGSNLRMEMQDLTPLLSKIDFDVTVNLNLTAEEKLNRFIYKQNNWNY